MASGTMVHSCKFTRAEVTESSLVFLCNRFYFQRGTGSHFCSFLKCSLVTASRGHTVDLPCFKSVNVLGLIGLAEYFTTCDLFRVSLGEVYIKASSSL